jgi:hypothetical protein
MPTVHNPLTRLCECSVPVWTRLCDCSVPPRTRLRESFGTAYLRYRLGLDCANFRYDYCLGLVDAIPRLVTMTTAAHPSGGFSSRIADAGCDSLDGLIPKVNTADGRIRDPSGRCSKRMFLTDASHGCSSRMLLSDASHASLMPAVTRWMHDCAHSQGQHCRWSNSKPIPAQ